MASSSPVFFIAVLFCFTLVRAEVEDLQPLVKTTEDTLQGAKTHVEHMLSLSPIPNQEKLPAIVKAESEHLAYEIKKLATKLQEKISAGEHKAELKQAVTTAVTNLNEAATTLEHVGSDLKQDNTKYYAAADKILHEAKNILASGPCPEVAPIIKGALNELTHDVNNYQYGIHNVIGTHEGGTVEAGHKHDGTHHHVHQHGAASSEESSEEQGSSSHHHHDHHHH